MKTTDHTTIKEWTEARGGKPSVMDNTANQNGGHLTINFSKSDHEDLKEVSWEEFFVIFDEEELEFEYQEQTLDGVESRYFRIREREKERKREREEKGKRGGSLTTQFSLLN